ncbi:MAG TPA: amidohydrolase family protein [Terracidiphilus sp.]|jgi:imidazolonepropionase-like amidohydrolase
MSTPTLLARCDPTGDGGVLAGLGDQREIELLVDAGFSPSEAIQIATQHGANFLGIGDRTGTIAEGKRADLVVVRGDPSARISDIDNVEIVFRRGVGYNAPKIMNAISGIVSLP